MRVLRGEALAAVAIMGTTVRGRLLLMAATEEVPVEGVIVAAFAQPYRKPIEHAGKPYQELLARQRSGLYHAEENGHSPAGSSSSTDEGEDGTADGDEDEDTPAWQLKKLTARNSDDLYELLELGDKRWHATEDDIKKAFRRLSLKYHPDKIAHAGEEAMEDAGEHFKAMRKAFDTLSDRRKRAAYDSIDEVDDSIPSEKEAGRPGAFFDVMTKAFELNARWSSSNKVPKLGGEKTPMAEVHAFYDFWYRFKSWRDFSADLEFDPEQADSREERRWMDRQNAKHIKKRRAAEASRIRLLVDRAYKLDPRIVNEKAATTAARDAARAEKAAARAAAEKAAAEKAAAEKAAAEIAEAEEKSARLAAKKTRGNDKRALRKLRSRVRATVPEDADPQVALAAETLIQELSMEKLSELVTTVEELAAAGRSADLVTTFSTAYDNFLHPDREPKEAVLSNGHAADANGGAANGDEAAKPAKEMKEWTSEEESTLAKAMHKYPGGTLDRWTKLAEYMQTRSPEEVLHKVNQMRKATAAAGAKNVPAAGATSNGGADAPNDFARFAEKKKGTPLAAAATKAPVDLKTVPNSLNFSKKQQSALESAMRKFAKQSGPQKWISVSNSVTGKTPVECEERYSELVAFYTLRKAAGMTKGGKI